MSSDFNDCCHVPGLLSSVANASFFKPGCAGRSSGTDSQTQPNCRVSSRSRTPSLLSTQGCMNIRDGQVTSEARNQRRRQPCRAATGNFSGRAKIKRVPSWGPFAWVDECGRFGRTEPVFTYPSCNRSKPLQPSGPAAHQRFVTHQNTGQFRYEIDKYRIFSCYSRPRSSRARRARCKDQNSHRRD